MTSPKHVRPKRSVSSIGSRASLNDYLASSVMSHDSIFDGPGLGTSVPSSVSSFNRRSRYGSDASVSQFSVDYLQSEYNMSRYDAESVAAMSMEPRSHIPKSTGSAYSDEEELTEMMMEELNTHPVLLREDYADENDKRTYQAVYLIDEDLEIMIAGFKTDKTRLYVYRVLCVLSFGLLYLLFRWMPRWYVKYLGKSEPFASADWLSVETQWGEFSIHNLQTQFYENSLSTVFGASIRVSSLKDIDTDPFVDSFRYVSYRYTKFIYHPLLDCFLLQKDWKDPKWIRGTENVKSGLEREAINDRLKVFGNNDIDLKVKSAGQLLVDEVLHPFYIFQVFSIVLWCMDSYYYYAVCILLISVISVLNSLFETQKTMKRMREMSRFVCSVRVYRDGFWTSISSTDLVVGDVFELSDPELTTLPCDALLLTGDCVVNESMLTGESVPVSKLPTTDQGMHELFNFNDSVPASLAKHFLFCGTKLIQVRKPYVNGKEEGTSLAMAVRTGFNTTQGALVRSMLFPKPVGFKFYKDSFRFIIVMFGFALLGFVTSSVQFVRLGVHFRTILFRALDLVTIVVPPALPATLTIGITFAVSRLRKKGIFCISPQRVNVSGKLDVISFDKTGTLTEDGLDILGVLCVDDDKLGEMRTGVNDLCSKDLMSFDCPSGLLYTMATCHMLRLVDGELLGDPLDVKMFEFTNWAYSEENSSSKKNNNRLEDTAAIRAQHLAPPTVSPPWASDYSSMAESDLEFGLIKTFEFVSNLRRMSVIVKHGSAKQFSVYVKGAPEIMPSVCKPDSFPENYQETLDYYTHNGFRVIACAMKKLDNFNWAKAQKMKRDQAESDLTFCGFIIFENKLKSTTSGVIRELNDANIRTVMCTGDNVLTAICVGRQCGILPEDGLVFIPRLVENADSEEGDTTVLWEEIGQNGLTLDPKTLVPNPSPEETTLSIPTELHKLKNYHIAITGDVFRWIAANSPAELFNKLLLKAQIFARMSPSEKHELVSNLQALDYCVGFCGDGANDVGALKAANVGISLSEAEASVAAPFTSKSFDISCTLDVIKDGRAALVTSFSCFQYMALYSAIQFTTVSILYMTNSNLGDFQFLYIDLFIILPMAIFMGRSRPYHRLSRKRPTANLVSKRILAPLFGQIILLVVAQLVVVHVVRQQPWYIPPEHMEEGSSIFNSDVTSLFLVTCFQYVFIGIVLTVGPPYRERLFRNVSFVITILVLIVLNSWLVLGGDNQKILTKLLQISPSSLSFKRFIFAVAAVYYVLSALGQDIFFVFLIKKATVFVNKMLGRPAKVSKKLYKRLLRNQEPLK
ncbi:P-type ATPase P5 type [Schizosaccharomyces japonicus yFS275]|uniref:Cation-transporting ATPase n=1 Tax=Schizosaccharomyces japonicus (strain yFS275 / FY16936) TaxID=402676 RepID=B6K597_SCHJY|nr:P-type ATPase P5 type [Schizosaccharomyces japonicus yFS275]EEB08701.1 P-type ATPase P5 type [Schizosaccharomyces japonicus yFS275]